MGTFRVEIQAVGGHGCNRSVKDGEINEGCKQPNCPDCIARHFVGLLKANYTNVESAVLIHWPGTKEEVRDDLLTGIRHGNF